MVDRYHFLFLIRSWKSIDFFDRCVSSIFFQKSHNYEIIFIDDCSGYTSAQKAHITRKLTNHTVIFNTEKKYAIRNAFEALQAYSRRISTDQQNKTIVVSLDGDDWLARNDVLTILEKAYTKYNCLFTYGNCTYYEPGSWRHNKRATTVDPTTNRRYPRAVEMTNKYRSRLEFPPLHLKTWRLDAFLQIPKNAFLRPDGSWLQFCEDQAILYPLFEMARGRYTVIDEVLSVYNRSHQWSDDRYNTHMMVTDELCIRKKG